MSTQKTIAEEYELAERELITEFVAMFRYATSSGLGPIPDHVVQTMDELGRAEGPVSIVAMVEGHRDLAVLVHPATPRGLDILIPGRSGRRSMPPVTYGLMIAAFLSLSTMLGTALRQEINTEPISIFAMEGSPLAINLTFLLASAAVGASFHGLYTLSSYLSKATYDPLYNPSYWIRLFLGTLSGILLAIIDIGQALPSQQRSLLALAGGFSTMLLYNVLQRLVSTFDGLLQRVISVVQLGPPSGAAPAPPQELAPPSGVAPSPPLPSPLLEPRNLRADRPLAPRPAGLGDDQPEDEQVEPQSVELDGPASGQEAATDGDDDEPSATGDQQDAPPEPAAS